MPVHIERSHTIDVDGGAREVFPLFTPKGEEAWIDSWRPDYLHPTSGKTCEGMVFRTGEGSDLTLWTCVLWRPDEHHVRYVRVTPASRVGIVDVVCRARSNQGTKVTVSDAFTAISADGIADLAQLDSERFAAMIEDWRVAIARFLTSRAARTGLRQA